MQIVSWNCKYFWMPRYYGFSELKHNKIVSEYPKNDILIIQEITYFEYVNVLNKFEYKYSDWYCDGKDSMLGIAIFSNKYIIQKMVDDMFYLPFRYIVPYKINEIENNKNEYYIFSVWTKKYIKNDNFHKYDYVENLIEAIKYFNKINILNNKSIIIGDFNSGTTIDHSYESHIELVNLLNNLDFINTSINNIPNMEYVETYFDNYGKGYTNDYCFISKEINKNEEIKFEIGKKDIWIDPDLSDHCPIIININSKTSPTALNKR